jgi:hypothetical protein
MNYSDNIFSIAKNKNEEERFQLYLYLERYINDGSPSGFDLGLPDKYSPFNKKRFVEIPLVSEDWTKHLQIGTIPSFFNTTAETIPFLIHPMLEEELQEFKELVAKSNGKIEAEPTASGRTLLLTDEQKNKWFIKLHFPLKLGRFNRELNLFRWLSILERSRELFSSQSSFPNSLGFLYDSGGTFYQNKDAILNFGTVFREAAPRPLVKKRALLIPSFSLFALERKDERKQSVLADFLQEVKTDEEQFLGLFVYPLVDAFIFLTNKLGMIPEFNAQNLLYEYDIDKNSTRVIIRDIGDCFIDFIVRERENLHTNFCSYKTLDPSKHTDIYERRSFAFDFKLSNYILLPLIQEYCKTTNSNLSTIQGKVRNYFTKNFKGYKEYFNSDKWYSYPNEEGVSRNSYIENENPLFR